MSRRFSLELGAVSTFAPANPVIYLAVEAPEHTVDQLAAQLSTNALQRATDHPFVAHVTLHEAADDELIGAAMISLTHYRRTVFVDRIWVLEVARSAVAQGESALVVDPLMGAQLHPGWPRLLSSVGFVESDGAWTRRS